MVTDARPGAPSIGGASDAIGGLQRPVAATPSPIPPAPPPIRRDHEVAAVTGELHNSTTVPAVPEFAGDERPTKRRRRPPSARSSRSGPVRKNTSGGTVVTFPPQSAPTWSDPSTTIADRDPLNQPFDDFRPVEIGPPVRAEADVIAPPSVAAEAPADTGRVDPENEVVDLQNEAADIEQGFAT